MLGAATTSPVLVARDEGLFLDEGLNVEVIDTCGSARVNPEIDALQAPVAWTSTACVNGA